jgi:hypothetical protein
LIQEPALLTRQGEVPSIVSEGADFYLTWFDDGSVFFDKWADGRLEERDGERVTDIALGTGQALDGPALGISGDWAYVIWSIYSSSGLEAGTAKLNVFLGVPNLNIEWLPEHLRFLQSYMGQRSINHLFPVSVTVATVVVVLLLGEAAAAGASAFDTVALTLIATLLALAVLEHWFLVLPLPDEALWAWAFKPQPPVQGEAEPEETGDRGRSSPRLVAPAR